MPGKGVRASIGLWLLLVPVLVFFLFPVYWMVNTALKPPSQWLTSPPVFWPSDIYLPNFTDALFHWGGIKGLHDSLIVASFSTLVAMLLGVPAGYAMARDRIGGDHLSFFVLSVLFMPPVVVAVPMFLFWSHLGLVDTYTALVVQYALFDIPFVTWVMKTFFEDMPPALEESAWVNGASRWRAFVDIVLPVQAPAIVATVVLAFVMSWNEFTFAVILSRGRVTTLPFILPTMMESHYVLWGDIAAIAMVGAVPVVVLAFLLQRYLVRGLSFGAIRGG